MIFTSERTEYTAPDGRRLVLVAGYYHGYKAWWIEDCQSGRKLTRPVFWTAERYLEVKRGITEQAPG